MLAMKRSGYSFTELMVVLGLSAILIAVALPNMLGMLRRHQLNAAVRDLHGAIDLTRAHAIARGSRVMLVPLGADGSNWSSGWIIFVDSNNDRRPGPAEEVLSSHGPLPEGIKVTFTFTGNKQPYYIAYNGAGRSCSDSSSMAARWGTLSLFQQDHIRRIKISMLGRARSCDPLRDAGCEGADLGE